MPGLDPTVARELLHNRQVELRGYKREDGLYDIEGHLVDTKAIDFKLAAGLRPAGQPIHDMWLRITIDPGANAPQSANAFGPFSWTRVIQ